MRNKDMKPMKKGALVVRLLLLLAFVVAVNMLGAEVSEKWKLKADFSVGGAYKLSPDVKAALAQVEADTNIYVLSSESEFVSPSKYFKQANEVINLIARENKRIHLRYVDLNKNPLFLQPYEKLKLHPGDLLLTQGGEATGLPAEQLFQIEQEGEAVYIRASKTESVLTSALVAMGKEEVEIAFDVGKNAYATDTVAYFLRDNYFKITDFSLEKEAIPTGAKVLFLFAPKEDYDDKELEAIAAFLRKGHTVVYVADIDQQPPSKTPNTADFLKNYGIALLDGSVFEPNAANTLDGNGFVIYPQVETQGYQNGGDAADKKVLSSFSRPMKLVQSKLADTAALLQFANTAVVRPEDGANWDPANAAPQEGLKSAILSQLKEEGGGRVLAISTSSFFNANYLQGGLVQNGDYFLNLLNQLTGRSGMPAIVDKSLSGLELTLLADTRVRLGLFFLLFLPAFILLLGGLQLWKRKRS